MLIRISSALFLALAVIGTACGSDEDDDNHGGHGATDPDCAAIGEVCTHDVHTELAAECHEIYHDNAAAECSARKAECVSHCVEAAGLGGAGGAGGAGGEHG